MASWLSLSLVGAFPGLPWDATGGETPAASAAPESQQHGAGVRVAQEGMPPSRSCG